MAPYRARLHQQWLKKEEKFRKEYQAKQDLIKRIQEEEKQRARINSYIYEKIVFYMIFGGHNVLLKYFFHKLNRLQKITLVGMQMIWRLAGFHIFCIIFG